MVGLITRNPVQGMTEWGGNQNLQGITESALVGGLILSRLREMRTDSLYQSAILPPGYGDIKYRFVNNMKAAPGFEGQEATNYQTLQFYEIHLDIAEYQVAAALTRLANYKSPVQLESTILRLFSRAMAEAQNNSAISGMSSIPLEYGSSSTTATGQFFTKLAAVLSIGVKEVQNAPLVDNLARTILVLHYSQVQPYIDTLTNIYTTNNGTHGAAVYNSNDEALRNITGANFNLPGNILLRIDNNIPISTGATPSAVGAAWNPGAMVRVEVPALDQVFRRPDETGTRIIYSSFFSHAPADPNSAIRVATSAEAVELP